MDDRDNDKSAERPERGVVFQTLENTMLVEIGPYPDKTESNIERVVEIRIDDYDTWDMDHTMSLLILPLLEYYQSVCHGSPYVAPDDVPEHLRRELSEDDDYTVDDNWHPRWEWVVGEMIWAHRQIAEKNNYDAGQDLQRVENGLCLFGKYYRALWN